jgi:hypothetical protein
MVCEALHGTQSALPQDAVHLCKEVSRCAWDLVQGGRIMRTFRGDLKLLSIPSIVFI